MLICFFYFSSENTWEPEENLDCPEMIKAFDEVYNRKKKGGEPEKKRKLTTDSTSDAPPKKKVEVVDFSSPVYKFNV